MRNRYDGRERSPPMEIRNLKTFLRVAGSVGTLCIAFTCHAIYNMLVGQHGVAAVVGYALPILIGLCTIHIRHRFFRPVA